MKKLGLFCLLCIATDAFSQGVATVLFSSSNVVANHKGAKVSIARGTSLEPGDAITTPAGGQVNIKYINGTLVNIGSNSNYIILAYSPNPADVQIKAQLNNGSISSTTNGKTKETLKTPVVALAILGTKYSVLVKSKTQTYVKVTEGHVRVGDTLLGPGDSILVTPTGVINTPFPREGIINTPSFSGRTVEPVGQTMGVTTSLTPQWTGFYLGGNTGLFWSKLSNSLSVINTPGGGYFFPPAIAGVNQSGSSSLNSNGVSAGAQVGYNQQFNNLVGSLEISYNYGSINTAKGGVFPYTTAPNETYCLTYLSSIKQVLTVRPRLGFIVSDSLLYVTGGLATMNLRFSQEFKEGVFTPTPGTTAFSKTQFGWTLGAGEEYFPNKNWSIKAEYLFGQFGSNLAVGSLNNTYYGPGTGATFNNLLSRLSTHTLSIGINYHFT